MRRSPAKEYGQEGDRVAEVDPAVAVTVNQQEVPWVRRSAISARQCGRRREEEEEQEADGIRDVQAAVLIAVSWRLAAGPCLHDGDGS